MGGDAQAAVKSGLALSGPPLTTAGSNRTTDREISDIGFLLATKRVTRRCTFVPRES
jgi:hypothetical protein